MDMALRNVGKLLLLFIGNGGRKGNVSKSAVHKQDTDDNNYRKKKKLQYLLVIVLTRDYLELSYNYCWYKDVKELTIFQDTSNL
eukprot:10858868-Ditylum_brightwellii.AAC.1